VVLDPEEDALGGLLCDPPAGHAVAEIIKRDDAFIAAHTSYNTAPGPHGYFAPFRQWPPAESQVMGFVRGRAVDLLSRRTYPA
jgi:hypothetical protein